MRAQMMVVAVMLTGSVSAQILLTGTTGGKGNGGVYLFGTGQEAGGVGSGNNFALVGYGASDHVDLFGGAGDFVSLGKQVPYATAGALLGLPTAKSLHVDVALYNAVAIPVANTRFSATAFGSSAFIASKTFHRKFSPTPYSGCLWLYGFGPEDRPISVSGMSWQIPVGVSLLFGAKTDLAFEYDPGKLKGAGVLLGYNFSWHHRR